MFQVERGAYSNISFEGNDSSGKNNDLKERNYMEIYSSHVSNFQLTKSSLNVLETNSECMVTHSQLWWLRCYEVFLYWILDILLLSSPISIYYIAIYYDLILSNICITTTTPQLTLLSLLLHYYDCTSKYYSKVPIVRHARRNGVFSCYQ